MHNFVYLAQRLSQEFSCEPNFGGRARGPQTAPLYQSKIVSYLPTVSRPTSAVPSSTGRRPVFVRLEKLGLKKGF